MLCWKSRIITQSCCCGLNHSSFLDRELLLNEQGDNLPLSELPPDSDSAGFKNEKEVIRGLTWFKSKQIN